jgi:hypothetical protein
MNLPPVHTTKYAIPTTSITRCSYSPAPYPPTYTHTPAVPALFSRAPAVRFLRAPRGQLLSPASPGAIACGPAESNCGPTRPTEDYGADIELPGDLFLGITSV